jgi:hypothetical protein
VANVVTPGPEHVGNVSRVQLTSGPGSVRLAPCDPFFEETCFSNHFATETTLIKDEAQLFASSSWNVSECGCSSGTKSVEGTILDDSTAVLSWTLALAVSEPSCSCNPGLGCAAGVEMRLLRFR